MDEWEDYEEAEEKKTVTPVEAYLRATCIRVNVRCCSRCLFGPRPAVSEARKQDLLADAEQHTFYCHEGSNVGKAIICRGYYEHYKDRNADLRWAQRRFPDAFRFVSPSSKKECGETIE